MARSENVNMRKELVGKTLKGVYLSEDGENLKLELAEGELVLDSNSEVYANTSGDCCSHTWIEEIYNADAAVGFPILTVEDVDLPPELRGATRTDNFEEEMQYYGLAIETAKGRAVIAYRNSSNGYYGGNLSFLGDWDYANPSKDEKWKRVDDQ